MNPADLMFPVAAFILTATVKASVITVLVLVLRSLFASVLTPHARYRWWFVIIFSLVTPVGFETQLLSFIPRFETGNEVISETRTGRESVPVAEMPARQSTVSGSSLAEGPMAVPDVKALPVMPPSTRTIDTELLFRSMAVVWLCGIVCLAGGLVRQYRRFRVVVARGEPAPDPLQTMLDNCREQLGLRRPVRVKLSREVGSPCVVGWMTPVLLLPKGTETHLTDPQLHHVFVHELIHIRRHDIAVNYLVTLLHALYWFNPLLWIGFRLMREDREQACDAEVLAHLRGNDPIDYCNTLLKLNEFPLPCANTAIGMGMLKPGSALRQRILCIGRYRGMKPLNSWLGFALMLAIIPMALIRPAMEAKGMTASPSVPQTVSFSSDMPAVNLPVDDTREPAPVTGPEIEKRDVALAPAMSGLQSNQPETEQAPGVNAPPADEKEVEVTVALQAPEEPSPVSAGMDGPIPAGTENPVVHETRPVAPETPVTEEESRETTLSPLAEKTALLASAAPRSPVFTSLREDLAREINRIDRVNQTFASDWNETVSDCRDARGFFGNLSGPCRDVRAALRRGTIEKYIASCIEDSTERTRHLDFQYQEETLMDNLTQLQEIIASHKRRLLDSCNMDTYREDFPAFATLLDELDPRKLQVQNVFNPLPIRDDQASSSMDYGNRPLRFPANWRRNS